MQRTLTSSKSLGRNTKSQKKFSNIQKLTSVVDVITKQPTKQADQIIDIMRDKIKSNYDRLYSNYNKNKDTIYKNIQQVELKEQTNNAINNKLQTVTKQKQQYDKLKLQVDQKQKQIRKLMVIQNGLNTAYQKDNNLIITIQHKHQSIRILQNDLQILQHQYAILKNMSKERTLVKLNLKQKYQKAIKQLNDKKIKNKKLQDNNFTKKEIIEKISNNIKKEQKIQIPFNLAHQLELKLQKLQAKLNYQNILKHQSQKQRQSIEQQKKLLLYQKYKINVKQLQRQKEQEFQYQMLRNQLLIKQGQEDQIKKLCGVQKLKDIASNTLNLDTENLQNIRQQVEKQIQQIIAQKQYLQKQIQKYLMIQNSSSQQKQTFLNLQNEVYKKQTQLRRLKQYSDKKTQLLIKWQASIQFLIGKDCKQQTMVEQFLKHLPNMDQLQLKQEINNNIESFTSKEKATEVQLKICQKAPSSSNKTQSQFQY